MTVSLAEVLAEVRRVAGACPSRAAQVQRAYAGLIGPHRVFRVILWGGPKQGKGWLLSACAPAGRARWLSFDSSPDVDMLVRSDYTYISPPCWGGEPVRNLLTACKPFFEALRSRIKVEGAEEGAGLVEPIQLVAVDTISTLRSWIMDSMRAQALMSGEGDDPLSAGMAAALTVRSVLTNLFGVIGEYTARGLALAKSGMTPLDAPIVLGATCHARSVVGSEVSPEKNERGRVKMDPVHALTGPDLGDSQDKIWGQADITWGVGIGQDGRTRSRHKTADFKITTHGVPACEARFSRAEWAIVNPLLAEQTGGKPDPTRMARALVAVWEHRKRTFLDALKSLA